MPRLMPLALLGAALLLVALFRLGSGGVRPALASPGCDVVKTGLSAEEENFLTAINAERAAKGVAALKASPALSQAAAWKSADSSAGPPPALSHYDSTGRDPGKRFRDCGYPPSYWGENILYGAPTALYAFQLWKTSSDHYKNMVDPRFQVIGIAQKGLAWTTDFGSYDDSAAPWPGGGATATASASASPPATATATPTRTATPTPTVTPSPTPEPVGGSFTLTIPALSRDDSE
ncbi:MAG: CAP domain-containing protein [Dehalococcoidia bacterium]|nr:CAP domain-containing protein [Dehalococcoidia bacterium]